ncbi:hypothetical protein N7520_003648 [Penicillium odoratum]|uniref:uncharacterized protein n=1 Tax=Penicillium odoratum TaxID=1167516 RepID=UPI002546F85D|nr:uncharacterized protein N7520_003648 [Penicillium odoratum]KAJ5769089.1 hypothetical protein N7520_003648 [Penicillium odoratum]
MAPSNPVITKHATRNAISSPAITAGEIVSQLTNPGDIFSILLLLGPEIVQQAVAQLAGRYITPVAFSFGWVAYSVRALTAVVGDGNLMPESDIADVIVIGAHSGHTRTTTSWVLGRLLRDSNRIVDKIMRNEQTHRTESTRNSKTKWFEEKIASSFSAKPATRPWEALRISVYEVIDRPTCDHGVPIRDYIWYSGFVVIFLQLVIASIPWILNDQWGSLLVTLYGSCLALLQASLPQWRREKWACPKNGGSDIILTHGNGSRHAILILGKRGVGLDLEILARGTRTVRATRCTRLLTALLAANWVFLLVMAAGLKNDAWYLLGIGVLGSIQNIVCVGLPRSPSALGIHIHNTKRIIRGHRVADVIRQAEELYPGVGLSLVPVFFPGSMRIQPSEFDFWREAQERSKRPNRWGTRIDSLPPKDPPSLSEVEVK